MNLLSYFLIHTGAGPLLWVINLVVYLIIALILWLILKWVAVEFGVPEKILRLLGLLLFLLLVLSLFVGCTAYEKTVDSRSVGLQGSVNANGGSGKVVYTVHYR